MKPRAGETEGPSDRGDTGAARPREQDQLAIAAATEFAERRQRGRQINFGTLSEPAWDMLLALYIEQRAQTGHIHL